ncbi:nuclear transport factor 2 family protein [Nonomuraea sp. NPDC050556]|uniref:nuclear transport factor 2 family protein n=1 Tax=Nonomuraea sp. NPDC050556 TaxID=3364369 RepID=UPI00379EB004
MTDAKHPAVAALVAAINAGDRAAFLDQLAPGATLSDDGRDRELDDWIDREIFTVGGRIDIESQDDSGLDLVARFRNDTWGAMRTKWHFTLDGSGKIVRIDTGQA